MKLIFVCIALACGLGGCMASTWSDEKYKSASMDEIWAHYNLAYNNFTTDERERARLAMVDRVDKSEWTAEELEAVKARKVMRGLTERQMVLSWGPPISRHVVKSPYGEQVTFDYGADQYVYFHDGVVSWWHLEGR